MRYQSRLLQLAVVAAFCKNTSVGLAKDHTQTMRINSRGIRPGRFSVLAFRVRLQVVDEMTHGKDIIERIVLDSNTQYASPCVQMFVSINGFLTF